MKKGRLIVIEGACDGIGKTTQYQMLCNHFKEDNEEIKSHHFPSYNTNQGLLVEDYLKGKFGSPGDLSPYFINSLYAVDRSATWILELKDLYEKGSVLILDRYTTSSLIYQSALIEDENEKMKFIDYVIDFEYNKLGIKRPDHVIFLTAPFDLVTKMRMKRKDNDGVKNDIHESDLQFMKKVYENALFVANYLNFDIINCDYNNKMRSPDDIHNEIYNLVRKK